MCCAELPCILNSICSASAFKSIRILDLVKCYLSLFYCIWRTTLWSQKGLNTENIVFMTSVSEPQKSGKLFRLENLQLHCKQDSIPVGCVPTAKVASTPGGVPPYPTPPRYPTPGYPTPHIPYPLERTWDQRYPTPWKGHRTRDTLPSGKKPGTRDTLPPEKDLGPEIPYP